MQTDLWTVVGALLCLEDKQLQVLEILHDPIQSVIHSVVHGKGDLGTMEEVCCLKKENGLTLARLLRGVCSKLGAVGHLIPCPSATTASH